MKGDNFLQNVTYNKPMLLIIPIMHLNYPLRKFIGNIAYP